MTRRKAIVTGADCDKTFGVLPIARTEHPLARDRDEGDQVVVVLTRHRSPQCVSTHPLAGEGEGRVLAGLRCPYSTHESSS